MSNQLDVDECTRCDGAVSSDSALCNFCIDEDVQLTSAAELLRRHPRVSSLGRDWCGACIDSLWPCPPVSVAPWQWTHCAHGGCYKQAAYLAGSTVGEDMDNQWAALCVEHGGVAPWAAA